MAAPILLPESDMDRRGRTQLLQHAGWLRGEEDTQTPSQAQYDSVARYAFVYGDFRCFHRMGLIACHSASPNGATKEVEPAAHDLLRHLDRVSGSPSASTSLCGDPLASWKRSLPIRSPARREPHPRLRWPGAGRRD